jgi:chemotaxis response regulator CheB
VYPWRTGVSKLYIYFTHTLFAQGIRSLLRGRRTIQIVGMGKDETECLKTIESHRPEVILLEESSRGGGASALGVILKQRGTRRVVEMDIDHNHATVYDPRPFRINNAEDLVNAIQTGRGTRELASPARCGISNRPRAGTARAKSPPRRRPAQRAKP